MPELLPLNIDHLAYARLDQFEFEGSLVGMLLRGTCTEKVAVDESDARELARAILVGTLLRKGGTLIAFRMDDPKWSAFTDHATLSSAYFIYGAQFKTWWFLGFADSY